MQGYKHAYVFESGLQPANPAKGPQGTGGQLLACACNDGAVRLWALRKVRRKAVSDSRCERAVPPVTLKRAVPPVT